MKKHGNSGKIKVNRVGQKYGNLEILLYDKVEGHNAWWICKCICGNIKSFPFCYIKGGGAKRGNQSCGCLRHRKSLDHPLWTGHGEISGNYWCLLGNGAKSRNIPFNITIEYAWSLFLKQNRKCALSGQEINLLYYNRNRKDKTASLDRIDSSKGYIEGNVQWIHKDINRMKNKYDQNEFIRICSLIASYNKR